LSNKNKKMGGRLCYSKKERKVERMVSFNQENSTHNETAKDPDHLHIAKRPTHRKFVSSLCYNARPDDYDGDDKERVKIVHEMVNSEKIYLRGLQRIFIDFVDPLENNGILPEHSDLRKFLSPIELMVEKHKDYYIGMTFCDNIANIFQSKEIDFWSIYSMFINQYANIVQQIKDLRKQNPKVDEFFASREHDIEFYLIFPIQRIPRYHLYIRQLLKYTDEDHPEHHILTEAEKAVQEVCENLNEQKRKAEQFSELKKLHQRIQNFNEPIWAPNRSFISEHKCCIPQKNMIFQGYSVRKGIFFVFNDIILLCNSNNEYERHVNFSYFNSIFQYELSSQYKHCILCQIEWTDDLILVAKDAEEVQQWYEILFERQAANEIHSFITESDMNVM